MDQITRMAFPRQQLHKAVFTIPGIQAEGQPDQQRTGQESERNAYPLLHTGYIKDDHHKQHRDKPARKIKGTVISGP